YDQAGALRDLGVPIWAINATLFPTEVETNRKYAPSFQVILIEGVGHYPQVERPAEVQEDLRRVLRSLSSPRPCPTAVPGWTAVRAGPPRLPDAMLPPPNRWKKGHPGSRCRRTSR